MKNLYFVHGLSSYKQVVAHSPKHAKELVGKRLYKVYKVEHVKSNVPYKVGVFGKNY